MSWQILIWLSALPASNDKLRLSLVFLVVLVLLVLLAVLVFLGLSRSSSSSSSSSGKKTSVLPYVFLHLSSRMQRFLLKSKMFVQFFQEILGQLLQIPYICIK